MKLSERAWQAWPVLALAARNRQIITYDMLGKLTGMHAAGLGSVLEHIQSWCLERSLPPLSAIVVNKGTGLPSEGFVAATNVPHAFIEVFEHDWLNEQCPTPEQLDQVRRARPSNGIPSAADTPPGS
jgi:putative restriction endonuclease